MMTKKRDAAVYIIFFVLNSVSAVKLAAADSPASSAKAATPDAWVVAAEKFTFSQKGERSQSEAQEAGLLPKLILEQLAQNLERMSPAQEQLDQTQYDMQKKRLDLFLQLSKEVQTRDSFVLGDYTDRELQKKIKSEDDKIEAIKKQIADNLAQEADSVRKAAPRIDRDAAREKSIEEGRVPDDADETGRPQDDAARFKNILKSFVPGTAETQNSRAVALYKSDVTQLFAAEDAAAAAGYDSREFEDAVIKAGINALIRGRLTIYGGYASATVSLVVYPGVRTVATVTDVSSVSDLRLLAVSIARQLTPKITNSMPVELLFDIQPAEAARNVILTIDDVVYKVIPDHLIVQSGVHSVMVSSPGFKQVSTSYGFRGSRQFNIAVNMIPDAPGTLSLRLKKPLIGSMYANGSKTGQIDEDYPLTKIEINNQPILGQFISEDGRAVSYYIPLKLVQDEATLMVNAKLFDRSEYIDLRRRWMYGSYSALIISLMGTFYTYGTYYAQYIAYRDSYVSYESAAGWQRAAQICTGISIGCGVLFVYELVRYFIAADSVLPDRAYRSAYDDTVMPPLQSAPGASGIQEKPPAENGQDTVQQSENNGVQ